MNKSIFYTIFLLTTISMAKDIEGEFGFILGETLDKQKGKFLQFNQEFRGVYTSDSYRYETPNFPYKSFLLRTTKDKKIAVIEGHIPLKNYKNFEECKATSERVANFFASQYDLPIDEKINEDGGHKEIRCTLKNNNKGIIILCNNFDIHKSVFVIITDQDLSNDIPNPFSSPNIKGAFGFKFGEKFDLTRKDYEINKNFNSPNIEAIHLRKNTKPPFDEYILMVNPETIEIDSIHAIQYNSNKCPSIVDEYGEAISNKYDIPMKRENSDFSDSLVYSNGEVLISVSCNYKNILNDSTRGHPEFKIMYLDKDRHNESLLSHERLKIKRANDIDKSLL